MVTKQKAKKEAKCEKLFFRVRGEDISRLAREIWAENSAGCEEKAVNLFINGFEGISTSTAIAICSGSKELQGEYPRIKLVDREGCGDLLFERIKYLRDKARPQTVSSLQLLDSTEDEENKPEEELNALPEIDREFDSINGWLAPSGDFYPCQFQEHLNLADLLAEKLYPDFLSEEESQWDPDFTRGDGSQFLEAKNWIKVQHSGQSGTTFDFYATMTTRVSGAQRSAISSWCLRHRRTLPEFLEE